MGVIYKIINPNGSIYIGQTVNFSNRMSSYRGLSCKAQRILYNSLTKHGFDAHRFEIIHELPKDCSRDVLNTYETLYILLYRQCGVNLMNIHAGGGNYVRSDSYKDSRSKTLKGLSMNERLGIDTASEVKRKISLALTGVAKPEDQKRKMSAAQLGKKIPSEIVKKCVEKRRANGNYNFSEEHRMKISEANRRYWENRRNSECQ